MNGGILSVKNLHILNIILNFAPVFGAKSCLLLGAILKIEHFRKNGVNGRKHNKEEMSRLQIVVN